MEELMNQLVGLIMQAEKEGRVPHGLTYTLSPDESKVTEDGKFDEYKCWDRTTSMGKGKIIYPVSTPETPTLGGTK